MGSSAARRFDDIAATYVDDPRVTTGTGFGANPGLRVDRRIFAMLVDDQLVLKLPAPTVAALVTEGTGTHFESGGRSMREWVVLPTSAVAVWRSLAAEAYGFVASR